jgi:hypothetical protein
MDIVGTSSIGDGEDSSNAQGLSRVKEVVSACAETEQTGISSLIGSGGTA